MKLIIKIVFLFIMSASYFAQTNKMAMILDLENCIKIAKEVNNQKKLAETKYDVSKAMLKQANSGLYPSLELHSTAFMMNKPMNIIQPAIDVKIPSIMIPTPNGILPLTLPNFVFPEQDIQITDDKGLVTDLQLLYPIFTGGKISSYIDQAELNLKLNSHELTLTESEIVQKVKTAYYSVVLTNNLLKISKEALERFETTFQLTESVYLNGSGTVTKLDYLKNKMTLEGFRSFVNKIESNNQIAISGLKYYIGLDLKTELSVKDTTLSPALDKMDFDLLLSIVPNENAMMKKVETAIGIYESRIKEAESDFYPSVAFFGNYHNLIDNYQYGSSTKANKNKITVGLGMQLPIFNGFRTRGKVEAAEAELKGIQTQKAMLNEGLRIQISKAVNEYNTSITNINTAKIAMETAIENRDLTQKAYQNDMAEVKEFIESQFFESFMIAQYELALYENVIKKAEIEYLLSKTN